MDLFDSKKMRISFLQDTKENIMTYLLRRNTPSTYKLSYYFPCHREKLGTFLISFLEAELEKEKEFIRFIEKWGLSGFADFSDTAKAIIESDSEHSNQEYFYLLTQIQKESLNCLANAQGLFSQVVYHCIDIDGPEWSKELTNIKRYYMLCKFMDYFPFMQFQKYNSNLETSFTVQTKDPDFDDEFILDVLNESSLIEYAKNLKDSEFEITETFFSGSIFNILYAEFKQMVTKNYSFKKCKNCGNGPNGKRMRYTRTVEAKNKKEADKKLAEFIVEVEKGTYIEPSKLTFKDFIDKWVKDYGEKNLAPKTIFRYKEILDSRVIPALGHIKLEQLKPIHFIEFYSNLQEDGIFKKHLNIPAFTI